MEKSGKSAIRENGEDLPILHGGGHNALFVRLGFESLDNQCKSNFSYDTIQRLVNQAPIIMGPKWTPTPAPEVTYTVDPDLPSGFTLNASTG